MTSLVMALALGSVAFLGSLVLVGGARMSVAVGLVVARTFTDVGASSGGSLLPSSALSAVISMAVILVFALPQTQRVSSRVAWVATGLVTLATLSVLAYWQGFGVSAQPVNEALRLGSYLAAFCIAYRSAKERPEGLVRHVLPLTVVPGVFLILTFVASWGPTVNAAGRAVGGFSHANTAAAYFGVMVVACLGLYWEGRDRRVGIAAAVAAVCLFLTQSLGTLLGAALGAAVLLILNSRLSAGRKALLALTAGGSALALFQVLGVAERMSELDGLNLDAALSSGASANSLEWRVINWQLLLQQWWSGPRWFGFGLGSSSTEVMPLGSSPHSAPVQIAVETGLVGLACTAVAVAMLWVAVRRRRVAHRPAVSLLTALVTFAVVSGSASNLIGYAAAGLVGALIVGHVMGATSLATPQPRSDVPHVRERTFT